MSRTWQGLFPRRFPNSRHHRCDRTRPRACPIGMPRSSLHFHLCGRELVPVARMNCGGKLRICRHQSGAGLAPFIEGIARQAQERAGQSRSGRVARAPRPAFLRVHTCRNGLEASGRDLSSPRAVPRRRLLARGSTSPAGPWWQEETKTESAWGDPPLRGRAMALHQCEGTSTASGAVASLDCHCF
jgi:hypothetical protein